MITAVRMTRQQIFDLVWERPLSKVAPEMGMTDVGLRKVCKRCSIPLPGNAYWGKLRHGKPAKRPALRPAGEGSSELVVFGSASGRRPRTPGEVVAAVEKAKLVVATEQTGPQPVVTRTMRMLRSAPLNERSVAFLRMTRVRKADKVP